jgi:sterol desaturase/sphingolipid hydroxylase (fatty acid hydroxylase superfamily)
MIDMVTDGFARCQQWLFETVVQPLMFSSGLGGLLEEGFSATGWLLVGLLQIAIIVGVLAPWQRWRPVEPVTDRATVRTDMLYTAIHRLGLFRLALFFTVDPLFDALFGALRVQGWSGVHLDQALGLAAYPLAAWLLYLVVLDLVGYGIHRAQHQFEWWWKLHSLHHAQRQMTVWSDNRNHLLDDLLVDSLLVLTAQAIGVAPGQFIAIVAITQLSESFQHANLRVWFGSVGERLWVSPRFHRLHHTIGMGHESSPPVAAPVATGAGAGAAHTARSAPTSKPVLGGHNFGVLLPWWDSLLGTANYEKRFDPTGVRDQVEQGRAYGRGFWQQQWLGLLRLAGKA